MIWILAISLNGINTLGTCRLCGVQVIRSLAHRSDFKESCLTPQGSQRQQGKTQACKCSGLIRTICSSISHNSKLCRRSSHLSSTVCFCVQFYSSPNFHSAEEGKWKAPFICLQDEGELLGSQVHSGQHQENLDRDYDDGHCASLCCWRRW